MFYIFPFRYDRAMVLHGGESLWAGGAESERVKLDREEDIYKQEIIRLEEDLTWVLNILFVLHQTTLFDTNRKYYPTTEN